MVALCWNLNFILLFHSRLFSCRILMKFPLIKYYRWKSFSQSIIDLNEWHVKKILIGFTLYWIEKMKVDGGPFRYRGFASDYELREMRGMIRASPLWFQSQILVSSLSLFWCLVIASHRRLDCDPTFNRIFRLVSTSFSSGFCFFWCNCVSITSQTWKYAATDNVHLRPQLVICHIVSPLFLYRRGVVDVRTLEADHKDQSIYYRRIQTTT